MPPMEGVLGCVPSGLSRSSTSDCLETSEKSEFADLF